MPVKERMIEAVAKVLGDAGYDCWNEEESTHAATAAVEAVYAFLREAATDGTLFDAEGQFRLDA